MSSTWLKLLINTYEEVILLRRFHKIRTFVPKMRGFLHHEEPFSRLNFVVFYYFGDNFVLCNIIQQVHDDYPVSIFMFKVNNRNTRTRCEICSKLTKTPERRQALYIPLYVLILPNFATQCGLSTLQTN